MAAKQIKVVLSLDDAGFSSKTKAAREVVKGLELDLTQFGKAADKMESSVSTLSKKIDSFSGGFNGLEKTLQAVVAQIQQAGEKFASASAGMGRMATSAKDLNTNLNPLARSLSGVSAGNRELAETLSATQTRLLAAREGYSKLDAAQKSSAATAKQASKEMIDARVAAARAEIENDDKVIAKRRATVEELKALSLKQNNEAVLIEDWQKARVPKGQPNGGTFRSLTPEDKASLAQEAERMRQNAVANELMAMSIQENIDKMTAEAAARRTRLAGLEQEIIAEKAAAEANAQRARMEKAVGASNTDTVDKLRAAAAVRDAQNEKDRAVALENFGRLNKQLKDQEARDFAAAEQAKQRALKETERENARVARQMAQDQKTQADEIAKMWKGMAQGYAALKIEQGLGASVGQASDYERTKMRVSALNLGADKEKEFYAGAASIRAQAPQVSENDAAKINLAGLSGLGKFDPAVMAQIMPTIAKTVTNMATLFPDMAHSVENSARNAMGLVEAMGATANPAKAKEILNAAQQSIIGSGGKLSFEDLEKNFRMSGMGNVANMDVNAIFDIMAFMNQMKVMGGGGGGSSGGVSTSGVMQKMMLNTVSGGKKLTKTAQNELVDFGVLDQEQVKRGDYAWKGSQEGSQNIIQYAAQIAKSIMDQMVNDPKLRAKYFKPGEDYMDPQTQRTAYGRIANHFGSTNVAEGFKAAGNEQIQERLAAERGTAKGSATVDQLQEQMLGKYNQDLKTFQGNLESLGKTVGETLLPILNPLLEWANSFLTSVNQFAKDNPLTTALSAVGAAAGSVVLAFKSFMSFFGGGTGVIATMLGLGKATEPVAAGMTAAGEAVATGGGIITRGFTLIGETALLLASTVGKAFLRMIPWVGTLLLAWDLAQFVGNLEIGGGKIIDWVASFGTRFYNGFLDVWDNIRSLWATESEKLIMAADKTARDAAAHAKRKETHTETEADKAGADKPLQSKAMDQWDDVNLSPADKARKQLDQLNDPHYEEKKAARDKADADAKAAADKAEADAKAAADKAAKEEEARQKRKKESESFTGTGGGVAPKVKAPKPDPVEHVDPLTRALEEAKGKVEANKTILGELKAGAQTMSGLEKEVIEELEGKRLAGDFNPNHDKNKPVAADNADYLALQKKTVELRLQGEQKKALTYVNERVAASEVEVTDAMERVSNDDLPKQSAAFRALQRELDRTEERLGVGRTAFSEWTLAKNKALFNQARADIANSAADQRPKDKAAEAGLIETQAERIKAELALTAQKEDKLYQMRIDTLEKMRVAQVDAVKAEGDITEEGQARINAINAKAEASKKVEEDTHAEHVRVRTLTDERAMETSADKLARTWADTTKNMDDMTASWASGWVDAIVNGAKTGKFAFSDMIKSMLADILKLQLQKSFSSGVSGIASAAGNVIGSMLGFGGATTGSGDYGAAGMNGAQGVKFANGGIMTEFGEVALRKYANGGVATSPQLAMFGEGSMNEAYVPLPDGRSIPVTMQGGGSSAPPSVTVNVINQTNQPVSAQQGQPRFDGKKMILDVVIEAASQPGPFRDTMKGAMK